MPIYENLFGPRSINSSIRSFLKAIEIEYTDWKNHQHYEVCI